MIYKHLGILSVMISFGISFLLNFYFIRIWKNKRNIFIDYPDNRKKHGEPTLLLGGSAIFISYIFFLLILRPFDSLKMIGIIISATIIFFTGLVDDYLKSKHTELKIKYKILGIFTSTFISVISGVGISHITIPFTSILINLDVTSEILVSFLWIFSIICLINFIDGMDALAGSMSIIFCFGLIVGSIYFNKMECTFLLIGLICSMFGFLLYNFRPAKIFMGDSGSMFIGYVISLISIEGYLKSVVFKVNILPIIIMLVPIIDNIRVFVQRALQGKKVYLADRLQIHLYLKDKGVSEFKIYLILVLSSILCILMEFVLLIYR